MAKFTVTMTQADVSYTTAVIEVEADDAEGAAQEAKRLDDNGELLWNEHGHSYTIHRDYEVTGASGGTVTWRED